MKIGFDISQTGENKAGCGFFSDQLIRGLAKIDQKNHYTLYKDFFDYRSPNTEPFTIIKQGNFKLGTNPQFLNDDNIPDIIHSNNYRYPQNVASKTIVTLYDVGFLDVPEYTTEANRLICFKGCFDAMLFADKIITISEYSRQRLLHFFPSALPEKIAVCYLGGRDMPKVDQYPKTQRSAFGMDPNEFFLSVGTIEPRKNYGTLLEAYSLYCSMAGKDHKKLCIAGGYGWKEANLKELVKELGIEKNVCFTGYVNDETLSSLYHNCYAFVYPSWYEGFGLPVLEALSLHKPVIASDASSLPEVTGGHALHCAPEDPQGFAKAMLALNEDEKLYKTLAESGYERSQAFSWEKTAHRILSIYQEVYESR